MPKERFHLLVAEQILPSLPALPESSPATEGQRLAYLLGAISPDALFYDLPSFRFSPASAALHHMEGLTGVEFLGSVIAECRQELTPETGMWLFGVGTHLLTDGFWHPIIEKMASFNCGRSLEAKLKLSKRQAHHWLESELEGFWLARAGPTDGYRPKLKDFARPGETREACIRCFQKILRRLGTVEVPDARRIGRCFSWQAFLLDQFSLPGWARWRDLLLQFPVTRFWGTLIVPEKAVLSPFSTIKTQSNSHCRDSLEDPFSDRMMAHSLSFLATHLPSLSARL